MILIVKKVNRNHPTISLFGMSYLSQHLTLLSNTSMVIIPATTVHKLSPVLPSFHLAIIIILLLILLLLLLILLLLLLILLLLLLILILLLPLFPSSKTDLSHHMINHTPTFCDTKIIFKHNSLISPYCL